MTGMKKVHTRAATPDDVATILGFITDLARYEKAEHEVVATQETLTRTLFSDKSYADGLIAEIDARPVGFAVYFYSYSTWLGQPGIYLEDLYVSPEHRGCGAGKALLRKLAQIAIENGCGRFEWSVLDWNQPAIDVYESLGARPQSEWIKYRLSGVALSELAQGS